jgi:hypothetical protein
MQLGWQVSHNAVKTVKYIKKFLNSIAIAHRITDIGLSFYMKSQENTCKSAWCKTVAVELLRDVHYPSREGWHLINPVNF